MRRLEPFDIVEAGTVLRLVVGGWYFPRIDGRKNLFLCRKGSVFLVLEVNNKYDEWVDLVCLCEGICIEVNVVCSELDLL